MIDLPRRKPRDQVFAEARSDVNLALVQFAKRHRLDMAAELALLAGEIGFRARLARGDAQPHEAFTEPGLTGVTDEVAVEHRNLVERCRTGELARDVERERAAKAGHEPQFEPIAALTPYELLGVLASAALGLTNSMLRVERGTDQADDVHADDGDAPEERTLTCST